jgi:hypothetical protein
MQTTRVKRLACRARGMVFTLMLAPVWFVHAHGPMPLKCPDRTCLIQASRDCTPARWIKNLADESILAQIGYEVIGTGLEEIVRREGDRCVYYMTADYQDVRLSDTAVQQ